MFDGILKDVSPSVKTYAKPLVTVIKPRTATDEVSKFWKLKIGIKAQIGWLFFSSGMEVNGRPITSNINVWRAERRQIWAWYFFLFLTTYFFFLKVFL